MLYKHLSVTDFLAKQPECIMLDVRSPKEYAHGHIPGTISFPLFQDKERHEVGLCYKKQGREAAVLLGLEIVGPKLATFVKQARALAQGKSILVYCWRGGMRSNSMGLLLSTAGFRVYVLQYGYKAYRKWALSIFEQPYKFVTLGGYTGTGKTDVLHQLALKNYQVVDLEKLAGHLGSAFGNLSGTPQPTTEQFENNLAPLLHSLNAEQPIFVEDESKAVGHVQLPLALYRSMQRAPMIFIKRDTESRLKRIIHHYGKANKVAAEAAFKRLEKRLGGQTVKEALAAIAADNVALACKIALNYYDKNYYTTVEKRPFTYLTKMEADCPDDELAEKIAQKGMEIYGKSKRNTSDKF